MHESGLKKSSNKRLKRFICGACHVQCSLLVEMDHDNKPVKTYGDKNNLAYHGFSCVKGREFANNHLLPVRLQSSQKRVNGSYTSIGWETAANEIASRVQAIVEQHGPDSVALFVGTFGYVNLTAHSFSLAWLASIKSKMLFTSVTIDQPGKGIAIALHGAWLAGPPRVNEWDGLLLVGTNPLISMNGGLGANPARNLHRAKKRGMKLVVIDPRVSESARKADIHLQCKPGADTQILASIARHIIVNELYDSEFVAENTEGFTALKESLMPFTPELVAEYAGVNAKQIIAAAELYGQCKKGHVSVGTGPNMAGFGNTTEYLSLVISSLLGHWRRAGEEKHNNGVFINPMPPIAAASGPLPISGFGKKMRVRGLEESPSGLPTAALSDEILLEGDGQIKALFVLGGNPMMSFPDQFKTFEAMKKLDLLVCFDPIMSKTAQLADYVIAPTMPLELVGNTAANELMGNFGAGWGYENTYAQVTDPVFEVAEGSDLVEEWAFFKAMAKAANSPLKVKSFALFLDPQRADEEKVTIQPEDEIDALTAWDITLKSSPVSHADARADKDAYASKIMRPEPIIVQAPADDWPQRLQIGAGEMMDELADALLAMQSHNASQQEDYPMRVISRRLLAAHNSNWRDNDTLWRKHKFNPAYMNPADLENLGISHGEIVEISSARATITTVAAASPDVRRGCISISHSFGDNPDEADNPRNSGGNTTRLSFNDRDFDQRTGIPRMSNIPVSVRSAT
ncbi:MAG: molybdopterin-dependent oxidoreductase [Gammaproteobacteria bacterium]|nr:molybdopterin-dependent oxidoreductase [Gammaproteobacteria bacterium]